MCKTISIHNTREPIANTGHERFGGMTRVYYKYAHGALIVFDLARPETFDAALSWLSDVTEKLFDEKKELLAGIFIFSFNL